ncbi:PilZ domain-containing protein [Novosphingobium gossypii]|uniref:PilZ domain-containing protein n=1 Tax=Novosphingobium gossypii TaxID=1604774 RepID=UPI003D21A024
MDHTQQERYAAAAQEDRSAVRNRISIPATLRPSGAKSLQTAVRDLSLSGFSATVMNPIAPRTMCWLTLPGKEGALPAKVVWWENGLVGCAFEHLLEPADLDAIMTRWNRDRR